MKQVTTEAQEIALQNAKYKVGDTVKLRSNSPAFTVYNVTLNKSDQVTYWVEFWVNDKRKTDCYLETSLILCYKAEDYESTD